MNVGTRVDTPAGPGIILAIHDHTEWTFGKPRRVVWINVKVDGNPTPHTFPPADITEQEAETEWPA